MDFVDKERLSLTVVRQKEDAPLHTVQRESSALLRSHILSKSFFIMNPVNYWHKIIDLLFNILVRQLLEHEFAEGLCYFRLQSWEWFHALHKSLSKDVYVGELFVSVKCDNISAVPSVVKEPNFVPTRHNFKLHRDFQYPRNHVVEEDVN